jgi:tetrahydromethanopterin S-methyltransferase subunit F
MTDKSVKERNYGIAFLTGLFLGGFSSGIVGLVLGVAVAVYFGEC